MDDLDGIVVLDPVLPVVLLDRAVGSVERFPVHLVIQIVALVGGVDEVHLEVVCHAAPGVVKGEGATPDEIHASRLLVFVELLLGQAGRGAVPGVEGDFVAGAGL